VNFGDVRREDAISAPAGVVARVLEEPGPAPPRKLASAITLPPTSTKASVPFASRWSRLSAAGGACATRHAYEQPRARGNYAAINA
jgi:hypothetical protein